MKLHLSRLFRFAPAALLSLAAIACSGVRAAAQESEEKQKIPPPVDVALTTRDLVSLQCTYYPGLNKKESVPVILLHASNGSRNDWEELALDLQKEHGFAVMTVDLRGYGKSTEKNGQKLLASSMRPDEYPLMVTNDLEAVKQDLVKRNNNAELNINKLTVVGAEMGAIVGMLWTIVDWSPPVLTTGKQGQDVIAVAMISPPFVFKTLNMSALSQPYPPQLAVRKQVSIYIAVGKGDSKAVRSADRLLNLFEPFHKAAASDPMSRDLFFESLNTKLQGAALLDEKTLDLKKHIAEFIQLRAAEQSHPWAERRTP